MWKKFVKLKEDENVNKSCMFISNLHLVAPWILPKPNGPFKKFPLEIKLERNPVFDCGPSQKMTLKNNDGDQYYNLFVDKETPINSCRISR